ncbi:hypothetical protein [Wolbachia endosymbiont (group A) of Anomoia purmunda]|uniref:hypothetical protein n=1 Tax=Wolbachia endosymbiont (group A) of Anomoia purmunda TaxID=2953978 RepID=UPI00223254DC|nr:hypothetical protein [Wolbachia endosymbiont (group A) of Anomoia purmunda]
MHGVLRNLMDGECDRFIEKFEYFLDSCPSFLHSVGKDRFFPAFFFAMFATAFDSGTVDNNERIFSVLIMTQMALEEEISRLLF